MAQGQPHATRSRDWLRALERGASRGFQQTAALPGSLCSGRAASFPHSFDPFRLCLPHLYPPARTPEGLHFLPGMGADSFDCGHDLPGRGVGSGRVRATPEPERLSGAHGAIVRLLCRGRRILFPGTQMDGRGCLPVCFSNFHGSNAGPRRRFSRDSFETRVGGRRQYVLQHFGNTSIARWRFLSVAQYHDRSGAGMQRNPVELGAFYHELIGGKPVLENAMAKNSAGGRGDPARNLTQRASHRFHRTALRAFRSRDDQ